MSEKTQRIMCLFLLVAFFFNGGVPLFAGTITATENISIRASVGMDMEPPPGTGGGNGGGGLGTGGVVSAPKTSVRFSGEAYPNATVSVLKNGQFITSVKADNAGLFDVTLEEKYDSTILYSLVARDIAGNKSLLINYPLVVYSGYLTYVSGIRFAPTVVLDKIQVSLGDYLTVAGYALPKKELQIVIESQDEKTIQKTFTLTTPSSGRYDITLPMIGLDEEDYSLYVKYTNDDRISKLIKFTIGDTNIPSIDVTLNIPGDCNADGVINLVDFSVLAFWYKKPNPPSCVDINSDGIVDLTDFSILAFYWTD
jgi:hypothetical protein